MKSIWNGHLSGLPMALWQLIAISMRRVADVLSTVFWRGNLKSVGRTARIQYGTAIRSPGNVSLGAGAAIGRHAELVTEFPDSQCVIGARTQINRNAHLDFTGGLEIGERVVVSEHAAIYTHSHGYDPLSKPSRTPLVIEDGAWVGGHAVIVEGVGRIGAGAVVAAGAVVTKEVAPNTIVGGVPARVIGHRSDSEPNT